MILASNGWEHCHQELAGGGGEEGEGGEDIKSNNPHLTGGELRYIMI